MSLLPRVGWLLAGVLFCSACGRSGVLAPPSAVEGTPSPTPAPTSTPPGAEPFGDGRDGPLDLPSGELEVNACMPLLSSGTSSITLSAAGALAQPGDRILLVQVQGGAPPTSGDPAPVGLSQATGTGLWELAEVASISGPTLLFTAPLSFGYASDAGHRAQACHVPQYTDVTVGAGARLAASSWDGATGGIVALLVSGTFALDGEVTATAAGFRGGAPSVAQGGGSAITDADTNDEDGGEKGEGIDVAAWTLNGRGNVHSGAGGGNRRSSGGGGGGSGGAGGFGGFDRDGQVDLTRGQGGARYDDDLAGRLLFGGGGGGGHRASGGEPGGNGGAGGGLVFVMAPVLSGAGVLAAGGENGADSQSDAGAGGGGAGGTVLVWANGTVSIEARGGDGGEALGEDSLCGPGGGGGGGTVLVHTSGAGAELAGGAPGEAEGGGEDEARGATAGDAGRSTAF